MKNNILWNESDRENMRLLIEMIITIFLYIVTNLFVKKISVRSGMFSKIIIIIIILFTDFEIYQNPKKKMY